MKIIAIGAGGFIGAVGRYYAGRLAAAAFGTRLPWGTLMVNVAGSFILGLVYTLATERLAMPPNVRLFIGVGFCGAFTTFSTFAVETLYLVEDGQLAWAGLNVVANVALAITFAMLGIWAARLL